MRSGVFLSLRQAAHRRESKKETTMNTIIDHHDWIGSEQNRGTALAPLGGAVTALLALWLSMGLV